MSRSMVAEMIEEETDRLIRDGDWGTPDQLAAAKDVLTETAMGDGLPGFFTRYAYVRYLVDPAVRTSTGPLTPADLRLSERVPGHGERVSAA